MNATNPNEGTYYPNQPGARTLADARQMRMNGETVMAVVAPNGSWVLYFGTKAMSRGVLDGTEGPLMVFFQAEAIWAGEREPVADDKFADAVAGIRKEGARLQAAHSALASDGTIGRSARAMARMHKEAAIMSTWTARDERGYMQYVSDGLADTDGSFHPLDRVAWKHWNS